MYEYIILGHVGRDYTELVYNLMNFAMVVIKHIISTDKACL